MGEDSRRASDSLILQMHSNIEVILAEQRRQSAWIDRHQVSDDANFKSIAEEITSAKATVKTSKWFLSILWGLSTSALAIWEYLKSGHK